MNVPQACLWCLWLFSTRSVLLLIRFRTEHSIFVLSGECNQDGAIYQATVASVGGRVEKYVGLAKNFKKRYPKHKKTLRDEAGEGQTSMSKYFRKEQNQGRAPEVTWKFLEKNVPVFNPITNKCRLCLREKFNIILRPSEATLNSRQEFFANCKHLQSELICVAPD